MKASLVILLLLIPNQLRIEVPIVYVAGEMSRIMQGGDLSAAISLDTLREKEHLYGLGPAAGLKGEILILDGVTFITLVDEDQLVTKKSTSLKASMLVYAHVKNWVTTPVNFPVKSLVELQSVLETNALQNNIDQEKPFPFLLTVTHGKTTYHVIDWKENVMHTVANHKQFAKAGVFDGEEIVVLGFYSRHHQGIFTPHGSSIHLHALDRNRSLVGHVDDICWENGFQISFPAD